MAGIKHDKNKPMLALIAPEGLIEEGKSMTVGQIKYGTFNYREPGLTATRLLSAALRHIVAVLNGEMYDEESTKLFGSPVHHLGNARACLGMCLQLLKDHPEKTNDLYKGVQNDSKDSPM